MPTQTPAPVRTVDPYLVIRPVADPGYLPIYEKANIRENQICITVDDCFQGDNLNAILDLCETYGAKITIFPIGKNTVRESLHEPLRRAYEMGMEFENHSYNHSAFYRLYDEDMAAEIYTPTSPSIPYWAWNYHMRFMRTRGGDNRYDLRTHNYIAKLGYYGMAHWSVDGSKSSTQQLANSLSPGQIYCSTPPTTTLELLSFFIPYVAQQGYEMLTLTEMFGYPDNEVTPAYRARGADHAHPPSDPMSTNTNPQPEHQLYLGCVASAASPGRTGLLKDSPDGVYGNNTFMAVGYFRARRRPGGHRHRHARNAGSPLQRRRAHRRRRRNRRAHHAGPIGRPGNAAGDRPGRAHAGTHHRAAAHRPGTDGGLDVI